MKNPTKEMKIITVLSSKEGIKYIPKHQIDLELCFISVNKFGSSIQYLPFQFLQNSALQMAAVKKDALNLRFIPKMIQNDFVILFAVKKDGLSLSFVKNKTCEICSIAMNQNPEAIRFVPEKIKKKLCQNSSLKRM